LVKVTRLLSGSVPLQLQPHQEISHYNQELELLMQQLLQVVDQVESMVIQVVAVVQGVLEILVVFLYLQILYLLQLEQEEQVYLHLDVKLGMVIKELIQKLQ
jgi:hypothetical protein